MSLYITAKPSFAWNRKLKGVVYAVLTDSRGLVWLGTENGLGLLQASGISYYPSSTTDTLSPLPGAVKALCEDGQGRLWMLMASGGLCCHDPLKNLFLRYRPADLPGALKQRLIRRMYTLDKNQLLFCTDAGAWIWNSAAMKLQPALSEAFRSEPVSAAVSLHGNLYLVLEKRGLLQITRDGGERLFASPGADLGGAILDTAQGQLFVCTPAALLALQADALTHLKVSYLGREIGSQGFCGLFSHPSAGLVLGSLPYGPLRVSQQAGDVLYAEALDPGLRLEEGNTLYTMVYDRGTNRLHLGTQLGFWVQRSEKGTFFEFPVASQTVRSLCFKGDDLYVGTEDGLFCFRGHELKRVTESGIGFKVRLNNIFPSAQGRLFASGNGLFEISASVLQQPDALPFTITGELKETWGGRLNDSTIYVVSPAQQCLFLWNTLSNKYRKLEGPAWARIQSPAVVLGGQTLILNSSNGPVRFDLRSGSFANLEGIQHLSITDFVYDSTALYFSAGSSVIVLDHAFRKVREIDLSPEAGPGEVRSIRIVNGRLWFSTVHGVGYHVLKRGLTFFYPSGIRYQTEGFTSHTSAVHGETVCFGGHSGVVCLQSDEIVRFRNPPRAFLVNLQVHRKGKLFRVPLVQDMSFEAGENNLLIDLVRELNREAGLHQYNYMLNGEAELPVDFDGRIALFNLAPGPYTMRILDRHSKAEVARWLFCIRSPWYASWWFRGLLLLGLGLLIFLAVRIFFLQRLRRQAMELAKQRALSLERERISADMHDDLGGGLSSIKLLSEMLKRNAGDMKTRNDLDEIVRYATQLTDSMHELVWSLNPRKDDLVHLMSYLGDYAKKFFQPSGIVLDLVIGAGQEPFPLSGFVRRQMLLCMKELFNNVVKHAGAGRVHLFMGLQGKGFEIELRDNGVGMPNPDPSWGTGLDSLKRRVQRCGGQISWRSVTGEGTTVQIHIPLKALAIDTAKK